ncbi:hypothetical protein ACFLQU_04100 [Verrucomicrobiota bacterium]
MTQTQLTQRTRKGQAFRFVRNATLFVLPFCVVGLLVGIVDPYNYFSAEGIIGVEAKRTISRDINNTMWALIEYNRAPCPNILLGDSRMGRLRASAVVQGSDEVYADLSYVAGTLPEMCATFWFASERTALKKVCFQVELGHYNMSNSGDRVSGAKAVLRNPLLYLFNRNVLKAAWLVAKAEPARRKAGAGRTGAPAMGKPDMTKDAFWKYQLTVNAKRYYDNFVYAEQYQAELARISAYCKENGIELVFVILPTHTDLQDVMAGYGLAEARGRFLRDLAGLGRVLDFNYPNDMTRDRENFSDPFHIVHDITVTVAEEVWGGKREHSRVISAGDRP